MKKKNQKVIQLSKYGRYKNKTNLKKKLDSASNVIIFLWQKGVVSNKDAQDFESFKIRVWKKIDDM